MEYVGFVIGVVAAFILGYLVHNLRATVGVLYIDQSDPQTDRYTFDITTDLDRLPSMKSIRLLINVDGSRE